MNIRRFSVVALLLVAASCRSPASPSDLDTSLVLCGGSEVFVVHPSEPTRKTWSWSGGKGFETTDDCKLAADGRRLLVSSSSSGVAVVDFESREVLFSTTVGNAHSIEHLPGDRIAVAGSTSDAGNRVVIFDLATGEEVFRDELHSGHGLHWDAERDTLWALGYDELRAYGNGVDEAGTWKLPDDGGHDLSPVPGTNDLVITTNRHVYLFDREEKTFAAHPRLGDHARVKSVDVHPATGRTVFVQAGDEGWWSREVRFLDPDGRIHFPDERLYKARWAARAR